MLPQRLSKIGTVGLLLAGLIPGFAAEKSPTQNNGVKIVELTDRLRVEINGEVIVNLSSRVLPEDHVKFDGKLLREQSPLTLVLNKPRKYICTKNDPEGRETIYELLPKKFSKLNYVGRLDYQSEGLILMTSSGDLTERLTHPRFHVEKEYAVHQLYPEWNQLSPAGSN